MAKYSSDIALAAIVLVACAALAGDPPVGKVQDRKAFIPSRKHEAVPGKVIGVLAAEGQSILSIEGRSGPSDQVVLGRNGASYRWLYVPIPGGGIQNLQVEVGNKGEKDVYTSLDLARVENVKHWGVKTPYALVEIEVNAGKGAPAGDSFVATKAKVLDGSEAYPLKVTEAIDQVKKHFAGFKQNQQADLDKAMQEAQVKAIGDKKATGPRESQELLFVTWLEEKERLRVHFRARLSDGDYTWVGGGAQLRDPPALPLLPPVKKGQLQLQLPQGQPLPPVGNAQIQVQLPPKQPPPPFKEFKVRVGTTFGVEYGMAYEVSKDGKLVAIEALPFEAFRETLQPPPGAGPGPRGGLTLPPAKE